MLHRIITEIEAYLATPMRNPKDYWEKEERRELKELLEFLWGELPF